MNDKESALHLGDTLVKVNFAVRPPAVVEAELNSRAGFLIPDDGRFRIDGKTRHAHLTLYMATYFHDNALTAMPRVEEMLADLRYEIQLDANGLSVTQGGYVEISYAKTAALQELQRTVVEAVKDLVEVPTSLPRDIFTRNQIKNWETYGYDLIGDDFRPHITLGRLYAGQTIQLQTVDLNRLSFQLNSLGAYVADEQGAGRRLIASFDIGEAPSR